MRLLKDDALPPWAMFCFTDFKHATESSAHSQDVAIVGDDFILLAPIAIDGGYEGLLIAEHSASGKQHSASYEGKELIISVPAFEGYTYAKAGAELDLIMQPVAEL